LGATPVIRELQKRCSGWYLLNVVAEVRVVDVPADPAFECGVVGEPIHAAFGQ
jgi:hypothetical protein